jgi:hypothetical protein
VLTGSVLTVSLNRHIWWRHNTQPITTATTAPHATAIATGTPMWPRGEHKYADSLYMASMIREEILHSTLRLEPLT